MQEEKFFITFLSILAARCQFVLCLDYLHPFGFNLYVLSSYIPNSVTQQRWFVPKRGREAKKIARIEFRSVAYRLLLSLRKNKPESQMI
jgi:hypothetical protein